MPRPPLAAHDHQACALGGRARPKRAESSPREGGTCVLATSVPVLRMGALPPPRPCFDSRARDRACVASQLHTRARVRAGAPGAVRGAAAARRLPLQPDRGGLPLRQRRHGGSEPAGVGGVLPLRARDLGRLGARERQPARRVLAAADLRRRGDAQRRRCCLHRV